MTPEAPAPEARVRGAFAERFGTAPTLTVQAPGRVNLIGEHTDYNGGFVLPCAIDFRTAIAARPRSDGVLRVVALDARGGDPGDAGSDTDEFPLAAPVAHPDRSHAWAEYVRGAANVLLERGRRLGGADLVIAGNVPQGAGLSSSASLTVATIELFRRLGDLPDLDPTAIAVAARAVENDYVGVQCGIMDQLISARGQSGHALLIDCRSLEATAVPVHADLAVLIVHSGIERGLVGSEYNKRRAECARAAAFLRVPTLRHATLEDVLATEGELDDEAFRRARHIVTENARVAATASALEHADTVALRALMTASHRSMRDDFEITTPRIDALVELMADAIGDAGGVRMTGGGFGGCVVAVLRHDALAVARAAVERDYRAPDGKEARKFTCTPSAGAGPVE